MNYSNHIRKIKKVKFVTTIYLSILIFVSCAKSNNTNGSNENKIETIEIPQIEKSQEQQTETIEVSQVEIPKKNIFQYIKIWADGTEKETKKMKCKLIFSEDLSNLTYTLADRTELNLKCIKPFETNDAGEAYATYILSNGEEIVVGYFHLNNIKWYVKFKALDGSIQEAELSNDKDAWN
jgi:PBP1b-binding outer membrane lipoprotein LpoB